MRRSRAAIGTALVAVFLLVAGCSADHGSSAPTAEPPLPVGAKPNIILVLTDDLSTNLVQYLPHVLEMKRAGTSFSNYYVIDSLCCPSRTAIFTGEYPHDDGVYTNTGTDGGLAAFNAHGNAAKSFAPALQRAGYRTALLGKYLNRYVPSDPEPAGWNEWDVTGLGYPEFDYTLNENGTQQHYGSRPEDYLTDVLSRKADSFIDSSSKAGKPFMLEVATFAPHAPFVPAPRYVDAYPQLRYPATPAYDRLPVNPPSWLAGRPALSSAERANLTEQYRLRVRADLAVDDLIAGIQKTLRARHLTRNTYVVFSSDNGFHLGEYRLHGGKRTAFDTDIRVPLVVTGPGVPAGRTVSSMVSSVDLAPTFETLGGAAVSPAVDGTSLTALLAGRRPARWQRAVLIEHHRTLSSSEDPDSQGPASGDPPDYEAIRTATALYVRYTDGEQEYYDTAADPYELHNLGGRAVPAELRRALTAFEHCHGAAECLKAARL